MTEETKTYLVKKQMERWCEKNKIFDKFNDVMSKNGGGRVKVVKVECWEAPKNSSIYIG